MAGSSTAPTAGAPPSAATDHLVPKLARIMGQVASIPKEGFNQAMNYRFLREMDLLAALRPMLAEAGIMIVPYVEKHSMEEQGKTRSGNTNWLTTMHVRFTITDGKDELVVRSVGYGQDTGDKGANKAMTAATKYALMKLFLVDTGDDAEADLKVDQRAAEARITDHVQPNVRRGGRSTTATVTQVRRVADVMLKLGWDRVAFVTFLKVGEYLPSDFTLPDEDQEAGAQITEALKAMTSEKIGALIAAMEQQVSEEGDVGAADYA